MPTIVYCNKKSVVRVETTGCGKKVPPKLFARFLSTAWNFNAGEFRDLIMIISGMQQAIVNQKTPL